MSITCTGRYYNGIVEVDQLPGNAAAGPVLVTFLQTTPSVDRKGAISRTDALLALRRLFAVVPPRRSLADELIAERRAEAGRE